MNPKLRIGATVAVLLAFAGFLEVQQLKIKRLTTENADLRSQLDQISSLQERNDGLAQQLKVAIAASQAGQNELLRLRGQASRLRQLEQENVQLKSERQQLALEKRQPQEAVAFAEQRLLTTGLRSTNGTAGNANRDTTDLGPLELQSGIAVNFDLGGGTNCTVNPTVLSDGNNMMEIKVGFTNADGTFYQLGTSRLTARPGQNCSISVGDRMIALAVTLKP